MANRLQGSILVLPPNQENGREDIFWKLLHAANIVPRGGLEKAMYSLRLGSVACDRKPKMVVSYSRELLLFLSPWRSQDTMGRQLRNCQASSLCICIEPPSLVWCPLAIGVLPESSQCGCISSTRRDKEEGQKHKGCEPALLRGFLEVHIYHHFRVQQKNFIWVSLYSGWTCAQMKLSVSITKEDRENQWVEYWQWWHMPHL